MDEFSLEGPGPPPKSNGHDGDPYEITYPAHLEPYWDDPLTPLETFPLDVFPPFLRAALEDLRYHLGFPVEASSLIVLGAVAIAIQGRCYLRALPLWNEPLPFWCLIEAPSGAGKSASLTRLHKPLQLWKEREKAARDEYNAWLETKVRETYKAAEAKVHLERARAPSFAFESRNATLEALSHGAAEQWGNNSHVTSEGSSVSKIIAGLYSNSMQANIAILLDGYSGGSINDIRITNGNRLAARSAISLVLLGQDEVTEGLAAQRGLDSYGFFSRLVFYRTGPCVIPDVPAQTPYNVAAWDDYTQMLDTICSATPWPAPIFDIDAARLSGAIRYWPTGYTQEEMRGLDWTREAEDLFVDLGRRITPLVAPRGVDLATAREHGNYFNKLRGLTARIACYLHAIHDPAHFHERPVPQERLQGAIDLVRFFLPGWYGLMPSQRDLEVLDAQESETDRMRGRVERWIGRQASQDAPGGTFWFSFNKVRKGTVKGTDEEQIAALRAALDDLCDEHAGMAWDKARGRYMVAGATLHELASSST